MAVWIFEKLTRSRPLPFVLSVWTSLFVWVKRPPSPRRPCGHPGAGGVVQPLRGVRPPPRRAAPERAAPATGCEADRGSVGTHGAGRRLFQIHLRAGLRELLLDLLRFGLRHSFLDGLRRAVHQVLRL